MFRHDDTRPIRNGLGNEVVAIDANALIGYKERAWLHLAGVSCNLLYLNLMYGAEGLILG